jgi:hypothetical protein
MCDAGPSRLFASDGASQPPAALEEDIADEITRLRQSSLERGSIEVEPLAESCKDVGSDTTLGRCVRVEVECRHHLETSELDLMARLAGMTLRERWSDWNREPFTSDSRQRVSVWEKAA